MYYKKFEILITKTKDKKKDIFISIFNLLKCASSQINLSINKQTFHIQGMDKSHVCLFDLKLYYEWFCYYEVNKKYNLCFDSNIFYSMISFQFFKLAAIYCRRSPHFLSHDLADNNRYIL